MKIQNPIVPYHDPTMEEHSITDHFFDFETPSLNFDDISNGTANGAVVSGGGCGGDNGNDNGDWEDIPMVDEFMLDIFNDSGNAGGSLMIPESLEDFGGNCEILPMGDDFSNPIDPCSGCDVLREIVHTNGSFVMKLQIHGKIGVIYHGIVDMYDQGVAAQNHEFQVYDFSNESILEVKNFLIQYCELRKFEGYSLIPDALAQFYDVLSVNSQENLQSTPLAPVNETMAEQKVEFCPNGGAVAYTAPAGVDRGESSMSNQKKEGEGRKKTKFAVQRERTSEMKLRDFADLFDLPINAAAKAMKVCTTVVKKKCRDGGVGRWPYRKIKGMKTKISKKKLAVEAARTPEDQMKLSKQLQKLEENLSNLYQELRNSGISDCLTNAEN